MKSLSDRKDSINRPVSICGTGGNNIGFIVISNTNEEWSSRICQTLTRSYRHALVGSRRGVEPIRAETGCSVNLAVTEFFHRSLDRLDCLLIGSWDDKLIA